MRTITDLPYLPSDYLETWDAKDIEDIDQAIRGMTDEQYKNVCELIDIEYMCIGDAIDVVLNRF